MRHVLTDDLSLLIHCCHSSTTRSSDEAHNCASDANATSNWENDIKENNCSNCLAIVLSIDVVVVESLRLDLLWSIDDR